jgi:hypothetical protein
MLTRLKQMGARVRAFFQTSGLDRDFDAEYSVHQRTQEIGIRMA